MSDRRALQNTRKLREQLAATEPCATCGGDETVRCADLGCAPGDSDTHEHWIACPDCGDR